MNVFYWAYRDRSLEGKTPEASAFRLIRKAQENERKALEIIIFGEKHEISR